MSILDAAAVLDPSLILMLTKIWPKKNLTKKNFADDLLLCIGLENACFLKNKSKTSNLHNNYSAFLSFMKNFGEALLDQI